MRNTETLDRLKRAANEVRRTMAEDDGGWHEFGLDHDELIMWAEARARMEPDVRNRPYFAVRNSFMEGVAVGIALADAEYRA